MPTSLTEEAVNDAKEAAHGADHRGHHLVTPPVVIAAVRPPRAHPLVGLQQQRLQGGCHGEQRDAEEEEAGTKRRKRTEQEGGGAWGG